LIASLRGRKAARANGRRLGVRPAPRDRADAVLKEWSAIPADGLPPLHLR